MINYADKAISYALRTGWSKVVADPSIWAKLSPAWLGPDFPVDVMGMLAPGGNAKYVTFRLGKQRGTALHPPVVTVWDEDSTDPIEFLAHGGDESEVSMVEGCVIAIRIITSTKDQLRMLNRAMLTIMASADKWLRNDLCFDAFFYRGCSEPEPDESYFSEEQVAIYQDMFFEATASTTLPIIGRGDFLTRDIFIEHVDYGGGVDSC